MKYKHTCIFEVNNHKSTGRRLRLSLKRTRNNTSLKFSPKTTQNRGLTSAFAVQLYLVTLPDNNLKTTQTKRVISLKNKSFQLNFKQFLRKKYTSFFSQQSFHNRDAWNCYFLSHLTTFFTVSTWFPSLLFAIALHYSAPPHDNKGKLV